MPLARTVNDSAGARKAIPLERVAVILNRASGSCRKETEAELRALFQELGLEPVAFICVDGGQVCGALDGLEEDADLLVVFGGDGTIRAAAERCGLRKLPLIPLPGGTMNMLPKALYGERSWQEVLSDTLAAPQLLAVGGGAVEDHLFFCAGIFGSPSLWQRAREAVREGRIAAAVRRARHAFRGTFSQRVSYDFGAQRGSATAIAVICPLVSSAMPVEDTRLEAVALDPRGAEDAVRLAFNAVFADWRADPAVARAPTERVVLRSRRPIPAVLDGELVELKPQAEVRFRAGCFTALVPAGTRTPTK